jgi:hypothetical protein
MDLPNHDARPEAAATRWVADPELGLGRGREFPTANGQLPNDKDNKSIWDFFNIPS